MYYSPVTLLNVTEWCLILGLLLDPTREQTIQTQIHLNSKVTTRESSALLPCDQKDSRTGATTNSPVSMSGGVTAPKAQVSHFVQQENRVEFL